MVNVELMVLPGLQRSVQIRVALNRVVLQDVAPGMEKQTRFITVDTHRVMPTAGFNNITQDR